MTIALSTMWAQQARFRGHMDAFARIAAQEGYTAIEPSHSVDPDDLMALVAGAILPIPSIHAPAPRSQDGRGRWNGDLNLAALDEEERAAAVAATRATIAIAGRAQARAVVVHLGGCGRTLLHAERSLRSLLPSGRAQGAEFERLRVEAGQARAALAPAYLAQARRSLAELVEYAAPKGIALGLENRLHYHEIPQVDEIDDLLAPYAPDQVGYWHDVGHAEVQHRLGLVPRERWLREHSGRTIGSHLHDVSGITDHRAPGQGDVDFAYIAAGLPAGALRTFEINQYTPEAQLGEGLRYLLERGVVSGAISAARVPSDG